MCTVANCKKCGRKTWSGCGKHLDELKKQVPEKDRCKCKSWSKDKPKPKK